MKFTIEKGIPVPPRQRRGKGVLTSEFSITLSQMEVGDSFDTGEQKKKKLYGMMVRARVYGKRAGTTYAFRGTRIWRTA